MFLTTKYVYEHNKVFNLCSHLIQFKNADYLKQSKLCVHFSSVYVNIRSFAHGYLILLADQLISSLLTQISS